MNTQEMQDVRTEEIHNVAEQAQAGQLTFPQGVQRLMAVGVESYQVDLATGRKTCYFAEGGSYSEAMRLKLDPIAAEFDEAGLVAALRAAQADTIRYPEFLKRATAAGAIGYWAFFTGRRVVYLGRKGEIHVEEFPKAGRQVRESSRNAE